MTLFALDSYRVKLQSGNLFRNKNEILDAARQRPDKSTWFRKAGANPVDAVINIPPTPDQELLNMIKKTLSETRQCEGTKIRPQQSFGRTMLGQIMTTDVGTKKRCDRSDCLVCLDPQSKGGCRQESVTYQINCDRSPCHNRFAKTDPLKPPAPGPGPPALYRRETSRTPYLRGGQHLKDYIKKEDSSTLWRHTLGVHDGVIGQDKGIKDYNMQILNVISKPLDRVVQEGILIGELDDLEVEDRAISLNSKMDFLQANTVTLNYARGARKPG